jgi:hypothetical protein
MMPRLPRSSSIVAPLRPWRAVALWLAVSVAAGVGGDAVGAEPPAPSTPIQADPSTSTSTEDPSAPADGDEPARVATPPSEGDEAPAGETEPVADPPAGPAEPEPGDASLTAPDDGDAPSAAVDPPSGALPSGQAKTDDEPVDDAQRAKDRRGDRGRREHDREEGQWQVFAPYPELGPIRYRDPESRRTLWLGLDVSGTVLPPSFGLSDRTVWTVRPGGAWAFALTPWLALGGRHELGWYDAEDFRLRVHGHQVELSSRPLAAARSTVALDDRLAFSLVTHAIRSDEGGTIGDSAGLQDTILGLGYGLDHLLGTRWRLGWQAQARHAWVRHDTQRQARLSTRLAFHPRPAHRLSLDAVGYYVNRDAHVDPARPRHSIHGQFGLGYAWVGRAGVGPWTNVRATTGFMSGEAPVYELREEALEAAYGEVLVGMLARWP